MDASLSGRKPTTLRQFCPGFLTTKHRGYRLLTSGVMLSRGVCAGLLMKMVNQGGGAPATIRCAWCDCETQVPHKESVAQQRRVYQSFYCRSGCTANVIYMCGISSGYPPRTHNGVKGTAVWRCIGFASVYDHISRRVCARRQHDHPALAWQTTIAVSGDW